MKTFKGYAQSYKITIIDNKHPLIQLNSSRFQSNKNLQTILQTLKSVKYTETLKITLRKQLNSDETIVKTAYFKSKSQTIINKAEVNKSINISSQQITNGISVWISQGSGWSIESVDDHYINIVKYNPQKDQVMLIYHWN